MNRESACRCAICDLERALTVEVAGQDFAQRYRAFADSRSWLSTFPTASDLLAFLHTRSAVNGVPLSDRILAELLHPATDSNGAPMRDLLLLAFIPMLHATSRQVASRYTSLSGEDIAQQAVTSLLRILGSPEFYARSSHVAFAISRALKRTAFEWAARESRLAVPSIELAQAVLQDSKEPFERTVLLRHFLHRCHQRGLLTGEDLELLLQFKLDAPRDRNRAEPAAVYTNASRQRMKRLLGKLRRLARKTDGTPQLRLF